MIAAIDWMVLLQSGHAESDAAQRLQAWLDEDPRHPQAWQQLQQLQSHFQTLRDVAASHPGQSGQARDLLLRPQRRAALRSIAALAATGVGAACWAERQFPLRELSADLRTATAQRRRFTLDDGSSVLLDARSAMDVSLQATRRQLWLRRGRALLEVAADPRPLLLHSAQVGVSLLKGQLLLERDEYGSTVAALRDHAQLLTDQGSRLLLHAGDRVRVDAAGITSLPRSTAQSLDWVRGQVSLDNAPLAQLVARLRPYRPGFLRISDGAAALRVHGVFALDDSDRTLTALSETLPVSIRRYGPITLIDRR